MCRSAATVPRLPVLYFGVWQYAQPTLEKSCRARLIESAPPGFVVDAVGAARKRMKKANFV